MRRGQVLLESLQANGTYEVTRFASRARSKISSTYELRNMDRQVDEMADAKSVAHSQVTAAESMVEVANAQKEFAELRQQQALAQLENFNSQEFTPELWANLAEAQREISQRYLDFGHTVNIPDGESIRI